MNCNEYSKSLEHHRYGMIAGTIGICGNILISIVGITIGILCGSISIIIQSINCTTDVCSSIITLIGFKLSMKPADYHHPYGHARMEYVCGLVITIIMLVVGLMSAYTSLEKILHPSNISINIYTFIILGIIVLSKLSLCFIFKYFADKTSSETLNATSRDCLHDTISTLAILISMAIIKYARINVDGIMGLIVSIFIIISAISMSKKTIDPLLSIRPDQELIRKIKCIILRHDNVYEVNNLLIHSYGCGKTYASVSIDVNSKISPTQYRALLLDIQGLIKHRLNIDITIQAICQQKNT